MESTQMAFRTSRIFKISRTFGVLCILRSAGLLAVVSVWLVVLSAATEADARTWNIDPYGTGDAPTIQAGIDSAAAGDTVSLAAGSYTGEGNRDIWFLGKAITVRGAGGDPDEVIIDCQGSASEYHRGFRFENEDSAAVLEYVTVRGGYHVSGGALYFNSSVSDEHPTVMHCKLKNNAAEYDGGAVLVGSNAYPVIGDCSFEGNSASGGGAVAVLANSGLTLTDCHFVGNSASTGAALFCSSAVLDAAGCVFSGNACSGFAGAVYSSNCTSTLTNCLFARNAALGGAAAEFSSGAVNLTGCVSNMNVSEGNPVSMGFYSTAASLTNCTFSADSTLGGLYLLTFGYGAPPVVENTIIAFGHGCSAVFCVDLTGDPVFTCCDIFGNQLGDWVACIASQAGTNGNISEDPLFCDIATDDVWLEDCSPCLAANNSCGVLIGAKPEGCACGTETEPTTWGKIKAMYK